MTITTTHIIIALTLTATLSACGGGGSSTPKIDASAAVAQARLSALGELLFEDKHLSSDGSIACQSCHLSDESGYADTGKRLSDGVNGGKTLRNTPTLTYASFTPELQQIDDGEDGLAWIGGLFHDGRADTFETQIDGPLLAANEMGNASRHDVIAGLKRSPNKVDFLAVFGADSLTDSSSDPAASDNTIFMRIALALATYERSPEFRPFSSKYDAMLQNKARFTDQENRGLSLFVRSDKGNCAACHVINRDNGAKVPLFTDFTYDNLGVPSVAGDAIDPGLFATPKVANDPQRDTLKGKFRVATLRNIDKTAPYMHNGSLATLREVVDFYNTRDSNPARWGATDYPETVNHDELGNLKLSDSESDDIVAFMKTLSDGYFKP